MNAVRGILFAVCLMSLSVGHCESIFDIGPSDTLSAVRSKVKELTALENLSGPGFPVYRGDSPGIKGFLLVTFFDVRAAYSSEDCVQAMPKEDALRVARVQFVPAAPPAIGAVLSRYGRGYEERYDDNLAKKWVWKEKGISAVLDNSGQRVVSLINDFTASEQEQATSSAAAKVTVRMLGCTR